MKRIAIAVTASALVFALLLSGCGKAVDDVDPSPDQTTAGAVAPDDPENVPSDLNPDESADPT